MYVHHPYVMEFYNDLEQDVPSFTIEFPTRSQARSNATHVAGLVKSGKLVGFWQLLDYSQIWEGKPRVLACSKELSYNAQTRED